MEITISDAFVLTGHASAQVIEPAAWPRHRRELPTRLVDFHTGVYADMSICCEEYAADETMLELVFAPVTPETGVEELARGIRRGSS